MSGNRNDESLLPKAWSDALKIVSAGHVLGLVMCGTKLAEFPATASAAYPLEIAAVLFSSGIVCSLFAFVSIRSARSYRDNARSVLNSPTAQDRNEMAHAQQLTAERLVIACLLGLSSAIAFFCGCTTALIALLQS